MVHFSIHLVYFNGTSTSKYYHNHHCTALTFLVPFFFFWQGSDAGNYARTDSRPVYSVGGVWPVVAVQDESGHILACVPLVDVDPIKGETTPPIVKLPGVTVGIALMREVSVRA